MTPESRRYTSEERHIETVDLWLATVPIWIMVLVWDALVWVSEECDKAIAALTSPSSDAKELR